MPDIGDPITLAELRALGEFPRWQEVGGRVGALLVEGKLPDGYPLVPSRLPMRGVIDLCLAGHWRQVEFLREDGSDAAGNRRIVYRDGADEKLARYDWYCVAPAGYFTAWAGARPPSLVGAKLGETFELAQPGHRMHEQSLIAEDWPYLTFEAVSFDPRAHWVDREDMWTGIYTVHAADPRVHVEGILPREPWFNTTIAVSHRWLTSEHPDPKRLQHAELLTIADSLSLHETQAFLIDYCSLPQHPRGEAEATLFRQQLPGFQARYKYVTLVLNTGSEDYATRAWCMFELMLTSLTQSKTPVLLNNTNLEAPLSAAAKLARDHVQVGVWNHQNMQKLVAPSLTTRSFNEWSRNATNVAIYNAAVQGRLDILDKFERVYAVADPDDRPIIISLLKKLAFGETVD